MQALGGGGFADFYIGRPMATLLEVARDGKKVEEHLGRFKENRKYKPMVESEHVRQYAVVDFRSWSKYPPAPPAAPTIRDPALWTVLFSQDFTRATIIHMGQQEEVRLNGRAAPEFLAGMLAAPSAVEQAAAQR